MLDTYDLSQLVEPLLDWYPSHARVLPWREDPTPYHVWVSEIMLQQTRVEAVKPFYARFMEALPDVQALAECETDRLLKLWEGLGYYNRVRNMQIAAQTIMSDYGGVIPADYEELLKLKGIGHYTAAAISSIAYGCPAAAVDGNVLRIVMRAAEDDSDIAKQSVKTKVEEALRPVIPQGRAGMFTQAMMELGATVCVPNGEPLCGECPWQKLCLAHAHDTIGQIPVKTKPKARRLEKKTVLVIRDGDRVLLQKRPEQGLLAGMYEFPHLEGYTSEKQVLDFVKEQGLSPIRIQKLPEAKHIFSHVEWQMRGYAVLVEEPQVEGDFLFVEPAASEEHYAIPAAYAAYSHYMNIRIGQEKFLE
ncbi:MAG: A/G-specific adenine glycosylase [Eubacterium sp.]|nr:A/G-specific adenine glycosylase [Eubacterium sp.]